MALSLLKAHSQCDPPGNLAVIWAKSYGFSDDDVAYDLVQIDSDNDGIPDDGCIVVGYTEGTTTNNDAFIVRLEPDGDTVWTKKFDGGSSLEDYAYAVIQASSDSIIVCGSSKTNYFGSVSNDVWILRLDLNGNIGSGWSLKKGSTGNDVGYDIAQDASNNFVVVGTASVNSNDLGTQTVNSDGDIWYSG